MKTLIVILFLLTSNLFAETPVNPNSSLDKDGNKITLLKKKWIDEVLTETDLSIIAYLQSGFEIISVQKSNEQDEHFFYLFKKESSPPEKYFESNLVVCKVHFNYGTYKCSHIRGKRP